MLTVAGAWQVGAVVPAHALALGARLDQTLSGPLPVTVWFYVGASAALLAGTGLGVLLAGGASGSAPFRAHPTLTASIEMEPPSTPCTGKLISSSPLQPAMM